MLKSKRSGGPRSEAGKIAASQNAIKTGAYARTMILPGESAEEFEALLEDLRMDFSPVNILENKLVDQMAGLIWKLSRLDKIELGSLKADMTAPLEYPDWTKMPIKMNEQWQWIFKDFNHTTTTVAPDAFAYLLIKEDMEKLFANEYFDEMQKTFPNLFKLLIAITRQYIVMDQSSDEALQLKASASVLVTLSEGSQKPLIQHLKEEISLKCIQLNFFMNHIDEIKVVLADIHARRLRRTLYSFDIQRAHGYLCSALFRVMAELRKQQDWRIRTMTAEVSEEEETPKAEQGRLIEQVPDPKID